MSIQAILSKKLPEDVVPVESLDTSFTLRRLTFNERQDLFEFMSDNEKARIGPVLVAMSIIDPETNEKLYKTVGLGELVELVGANESDVVELLFEKADELSKITETAVKDEEKK